MFDVVAASLTGVANLCLAGAFAALWWVDRGARFNLHWAGGFAAVGIAATALTTFRATDHVGLLALTVLATGAAAALLFTGTRLYTGSARPRELPIALAAAWTVLVLCGLGGAGLRTLVGSFLIAAVFGWIGVIFVVRSALDRVTGALFLARAGLLTIFPFVPEGAVAPLFVASHFLVLATGLALLTSAFMRNQKRLEEEERERGEHAARLDILYRETPALLVVLGADRLVAAVSNDWLGFTGYARDEVLGRDALTFVAPEMRARIAGDVVQHLEYGTRVDDFEHQIIRRNGSVATVRTAMRSHRNPVTDRVEIIALSVDESARRLAEQTARRTEYLLERIVNMLPAAVTVKDEELRLTLWNSHAGRLFGLPTSEVLGRQLTEASSNPAAESMEAVDRAVLAGARPPAQEMQVTVKGEPRWIMMEKAPLLSPGGAIEGVVSAALDITEQKLVQAELQQSREDLVQAQRLGRTGYVRSDYRTGRIVWSETMFELRGVPRRDSFSIEEGMAFVHPEDCAAYIAARDPAIAERRRFEVEVRILRPDGRLQWEHAIGHPQFDDDGTPVGMLLVVQDVTERKLIEIALRASEARFAGAFHGSTDMMALMTTADGRFVEVNETWLSVAGFTCDEVIGRTARELGFWANEKDRERIAGLRTAGAPVNNLEMKMRSRGEIRDIRISGSRIALGSDDYYFWVGRDVTEEMEAQRQIAALNAANEAALRQIRNIAHNLPVLIAHTDRARRFLFVNRTGEQWFARPASEIVGKSLDEIMGDGFTRRSADVVAEVLAGQTRTLEGRILYPDGKERDVEIAYVPDISTDGTVNSYYSLVTDITERRATEMQLRQSQRMEAIGKLTGGVAHDFNNLLGVISGNLELVDESIDDEELRKMLRTAIRATERGATLTRSLLAYSRQQPLMPQVVDLNDLVREMAEMFQRTMPGNIEIQVAGGAGLWRCEADPGQLQNALLNLVVNARDAMPEGGRLTIEYANARLDDDYASTHAEVAPGQYVVLAVSDTGAGMPETVLARAFDPFFTTKEVGKGTGLGLSMVYGFAKQSRGHVKIYSEVGQGTTVRLYLPRAADTTDVPVATPTVTASRGETVLLVEDSPDFRTLTFALLRSFGYQVLEAADAQTGLRLLEQHPETALLLTDVVLPGEMNGERLAARAKQMRPHLRVLYMSGYTENAILHHGRLDRGVQLLQKPFRKHDLAVKVRAVLDRKEAAR